jgi:hypothetical protein
MHAFKHLLIRPGSLLRYYLYIKLFVLKATIIIVCLNNLIFNIRYFSIEVKLHIHAAERSVFNLEISKCLVDAGFKDACFYICCPTLKKICLLMNVLLTTNNELTSQQTSRTTD